MKLEERKRENLCDVPYPGLPKPGTQHNSVLLVRFSFPNRWTGPRNAEERTEDRI